MSDEKKKPTGPPQSELLVQLAEEQFTVGQSNEGDVYAVEHGLLPGIARPLRGRGSFRAVLSGAYRAKHGRPPSQSALTDAITALEAQAFDTERRELSLRVAQPDPGTLVVDLGEPDTARCVVIARDGFQVKDRPPAGVLFRRTALTGTLPEPADHGDLDRLAGLTNVPEADWPLVVALLVCALFPGVPHPLLALMAEQGAAKTTTARLLVRLLDPSPADVRSAPHSLEEWVVAASGSHVVALDNLSNVASWLQDALCRAATGEGLVRRRLYTDAELSVLRFRRVVLLTGIDLGSLRGDLADRTLLVRPERIEPDRRRLEADLENEFTDAWPSLLAGLYQLAARVLAVLPDVNLTNPPRMADYAEVVAAVDQLTGSAGLARYAEHAEALAADVLEADDVAAAVVKLMADRTVWTGSATELLEKLTTDELRKRKSWPKTPSFLSGRLRRAAPALRRHAGLDLEDHRDGEHRELTLRFVGDAHDAPVGTNPSDAHDAHDAHDAERPLSTLFKEEEREGGAQVEPANPASSASQRHNGDRASNGEGPNNGDHHEEVLDLTFEELERLLRHEPKPEAVPDRTLEEWAAADLAATLEDHDGEPGR